MAEAVSIQQGEPLKIEAQHFVDCVSDGSTPRTNGAEALRVLKILEETESILAEQRLGEVNEQVKIFSRRLRA